VADEVGVVLWPAVAEGVSAMAVEDVDRAVGGERAEGVDAPLVGAPLMQLKPRMADVSGPLRTLVALLQNR
jgi:hypothetical protein